MAYENPFSLSKKYGIEHPLSRLGAAGQPGDELERQIGNYQTRLSAIDEPVPQPEHKQNVFLKALSMLDRPRAAVWNGIQDAATGENGFGQGFMEGLTGKENYTGADLIGDMGVQNKIAKGVLGFGAELIGDPLNLVSFGAGSLAKGLVTGTARTLTRDAAGHLAGAFAKELSSETAEKLARESFQKLGVKATESEIAAKAGDVLYKQSSDILKKYGAAMPDDTLKAIKDAKPSIAVDKKGVATVTQPDYKKLYDNMITSTKNNLTDSILAQDARKAGEGLGVGLPFAKKQTIGGLTNAKMQDIGAGISNAVRDNVPIVGSIVGGIQKFGNSIFNPVNIAGLGHFDQGVVKTLKTMAYGGMEVANKQARDAADRFAKTLGEVSSRTGQNQDDIARQVIEGSFRSDDLEADVKKIVDEMKKSYSDMADKEHLSAMMEDYFPHKFSFAHQINDSVRQKYGGLTEKWRIDIPSAKKREYRGTVEQANMFMKWKSSTEKAQQDFLDGIENMVGEDKFREIWSDKAKSPGNFSALLKEAGYDGAKAMKTADDPVVGALDGIDDYFETSATKAWLLRALEHNKVIADKEFSQNLIAAFGEKVTKRNITAMRQLGKDIVVPRSALQVFLIGTGDAIKLNQATGVIDDEVSRMVGRIRPANQPPEGVTQILGADGKPISSVLTKEAKADMKANRATVKAAGADIKSAAGVERATNDIVDVIRKLVADNPDAFLRISDDNLEALGKLDEKIGANALYANWSPIEAYAMPSGVIEYVNGAFKKQTNEGMQALLNAANAFYKLWKPTVTGLNPDFHARNTFGNTMNTMLHYGLGALDPVKIKGGITVSALANGTAKSADRVVLTAGSESWTAKQALEAMMRYEAGNTFFSTDAADVSRAIDSRLSGELKGGGVAGQMKAMGEKMTAPLTAGTRSERAAEVMGRAAMPIGKVADASATVGNYVEMQGKATAFLNGLEEGMEKGMTREQSEEYAAEMANRYLFNYSDLTSVEKNVFRNIFPFYTWVRKNLPLQMEEFLNNPANYTVAPKYIRNVNQANETDTTNMPEWMQDSMALPIPGASPDEEGRVPMANLSVPQTDVGLLGDIPKNALNMLNPLAKVGIETATNRSLLTGAPLYRNDYEKNGALFNNAVNQFGIVRNARAMMAEPDTANKAVTPTAPGIPFVGRSLAKSYNPEAGARDAMWDYNRQLGNEVQHLKDMYGDVVPDTIDAEKWAALPPEIIQAIKETGVIPPYLKRTRTVTVPVDETPTYSKGYRARYITKTKNQLLEGALSKNGGL